MDEPAKRFIHPPLQRTAWRPPPSGGEPPPTPPESEIPMLNPVILTLLLAVAQALSGDSGVSTTDTRLLSEPAVSAQNIAFAYAGDLWICDLDGRGARRLTSHDGLESNPRFSPDGALVAFTAQYDGNTDVYVVPATGGEPRRLTWHPGADVVQGFTVDGARVLFTSGRAVHTNRFRQLFTVPIEGGYPERLPIPTAHKATFSPDGTKIAYTPLYEAFNQWKNYRGGTATRIWLVDVGDHSVVQIPQPAGRCNDTDPMWLGSRVYFRSDRAGEFNVFSYDPATQAVLQITRHADFPVVNASAGGGLIAYEQAGWIHLLDTALGAARRVPIGVAADLIETRPRFVKGEQYIRSAALSPGGKRAAFEFRGEIVTVPAKKGDPRDLTRTTGAHERSPAWSPDGKSVAYFSDASGEYQLHVAPHDGKGETKIYELGGAGFYDSPRWSPDSHKLSFSDNSWSLYWIDLDSAAVEKIAEEVLYGPIKTLYHSWSPDSKWIAYTRVTPTYFQRVWVYSVQQRQSFPLSDGLSDVSEPAFDAGGEYLYFLASTDAGPVRSWFAMSSSEARMNHALYLAVLEKGTPSPLAPESDEEGAAEEKESEEEEAEQSGEGGAAEETAGDEPQEESGESAESAGQEEAEGVDVTIDLDGLERRIVALPVREGYYSGLRAGEAGKVYYLRGESGRALGGRAALDLYRFDLEKREEDEVAKGVAGFALAPDGKKMLVHAGDAWVIADAGPKVDVSQGRLATGALELKIDPRAEWVQIFDEAWRINRDWFYATNYHGCDWPAMREKYKVFLPHLAVRSDLNRVIRWMCSELSVGHHYGGGGDTLVHADTVPVGLLGADFEVADGRYRFAKVFGGLNWNPELSAPLSEPGVDVAAGEYLLAVAGVDLAPPENLYGRFENTVGKQVTIAVGASPDGSDARTLTVVPIANEDTLRNRDWVESNVRKVHAATGGRVAYVYVPNTSGLGLIYFKRYFFPQADKDAIIVDERHNGGGAVADYYIDILRRPHISNWAMRYGADLKTPLSAIQGPKVMLIDETAGSGGDLLPWMFRKLGLGTLVGRPTWGGLVGILGFPVLMDGGMITAPNVAFWTEQGFIVENEGVAPDVEVEMLPAEVIAGRDPQLERAIEIALEQLALDPPRKLERPPYPVRARK